MDKNIHDFESSRNRRNQLTRLRFKKRICAIGLILTGVFISGCGDDEISNNSGSRKKNYSKSSSRKSKTINETITEHKTTDPKPQRASQKSESKNQPSAMKTTVSENRPSKQSLKQKPRINGEEKSVSEKQPSLESQLAKLTIPPAWLEDVKPRYDSSRPWKQARLEIRRLLGQNKETDRKEAIKLTWMYLQKNDIGTGHEYPMYLFLGNEPVWAIRAYEEFLKKPHPQTPIFGYKSLSALYASFQKYDLAKAWLDRAMKKLPPPPYRTMREAEFHEAYGDLYLQWGKTELARTHYTESVRLYPIAKPKYGRHLLPKRAAKVQTKLDLISVRSLKSAKLQDGVYRATALGYSGDVHVTVKIQNGRIATISVQHKEKIEQNASKIIPRSIIEKQSLEVDGISGATITKDAIVTGTLRALKKAGLK
jgi:uncharacterized protein with FMN-binding domain